MNENSTRVRVAVKELSRDWLGSGHRTYYVWISPLPGESREDAYRREYAPDCEFEVYGMGSDDA